MTTLYFEDIVVGKEYVSGGRTITEADNTFFCMMSGDWNPIHCNQPYASETRFGNRIVAGLFGMTLITGAMAQWGIFEKSALAMLNIRDWTFSAPIFIGDTLWVEMEITAKRMASKGKVGLIERHFRLLNQDGALVQEGGSDMMIQLRPTTDTVGRVPGS